MWRVMFILLAYSIYCEALWKRAEEDDSKEGRIDKVHIIFRHGHREPINTFPLDPNGESDTWKNGPGQLTSLGKYQTYQLGQNLRARYKTIIPDVRGWKKVYATSSDSDRTLMSSASLLAGLIPPSSEDKFCDLNWQPCPIHTTPQYIDNILVANPRCNILSKTLSAMSKQISREHAIYNYVAKATKRDSISGNALCNIYTVLEISKQSGLLLPKWCESDEVYDDIKMECAKTLMLSAMSPDLIRLRSGPLFERILRKVTSRNQPTVFLYGTHDTVLGGLFGAFQINITEPPNFASVILIEFRQVQKNNYVQLWYQLSPESELTRANFPGCDVRCPVQKLEKFMHPLIPDNWDAECEEPAYSDHRPHKKKKLNRGVEKVKYAHGTEKNALDEVAVKAVRKQLSQKMYNDLVGTVKTEGEDLSGYHSPGRMPPEKLGIKKIELPPGITLTEIERIGGKKKPAEKYTLKIITDKEARSWKKKQIAVFSILCCVFATVIFVYFNKSGIGDSIGMGRCRRPRSRRRR